VAAPPPTADRGAAAAGLATVAELAGRPAGDPTVVVDCRFDLADPGAGRAAFLAGHLPGARYAHLDEDLAGPRTATSGRHPLPAPAAFVATCRRLGIGPGTPVVAYDAAAGAIAARLWWLLRFFGHAEVRLLDGGLPAWVAAGLPLAAGPEAPVAGGPAFIPGTPLETVRGAEELLAPAGPLLLDVRARDRYAGRQEPIDPVAGHVPGAVNVPFAGAVGPDGRFRPPDELRTLFAPVLGNRAPATVAVMCGSGVTACHGLFALARAGFPGAALYPGSWSEWVRDPARPVARGDR
jgi:thiosulfate/3-mercaptopyruvate sulfurtransferase